MFSVSGSPLFLARVRRHRKRKMKTSLSFIRSTGSDIGLVNMHGRGATPCRDLIYIIFFIRRNYEHSKTRSFYYRLNIFITEKVYKFLKNFREN